MKKNAAEHHADASRALVKYESSSHGMVRVHEPQPSPAKKKRRLPQIDRPLSTKTFLLSHGLLLLVSLLFLGGFYYVLNKDSYAVAVITDYLPMTIKPTSFSLELTHPEDESLVFNKTLTISGATQAKASLVVLVDGSATSYAGLEADAKGHFETTVTLNTGMNMIEVTSFDSSGIRKTVVRTVYYSEEVLQ